MVRREPDQLDDGAKRRAGCHAYGSSASALVREQQIVKKLEGQRLGCL
jgi:hypothetical protein